MVQSPRTRPMGWLLVFGLLAVGCFGYDIPPRASDGCAPDSCKPNATCDDSGGSPVCTCNAGFSGDGITCDDLDECAGEGGGHQCDMNATCTNTPGAYSCTCMGGYVGEGFGCAQHYFQADCWDPSSDYSYPIIGWWHDAMDGLAAGQPELEAHLLGTSPVEGLEINDYQWGSSGKLPVVVLGGLSGNSWHWVDRSVDVLAQLIADHSELLDSYTFHYIPLLNPDGYAHTYREGDDSWIKSREPVDGGCAGIHLDRNFDHEWDAGQDASTDPCDEKYRGETPFDAYEAAVLWVHALDLAPIHAVVIFSDVAEGDYCQGYTNPTKILTLEAGTIRAQTLAERGTEITDVPAVGGFRDVLSAPASGTALGWFVYEEPQVPIDHAIAIELSGALTHDDYADQVVNYLVDWLALL